MAKRLYQYEQVDTLPEGAMSVSSYAAANGCTTNNIYAKLALNAKGKGMPVNYKIVTYSGINFVLPK